MRKQRVAIITNIPSPYRVDLFYYLQNNIKENEWYIIYTSDKEDNRQWKLNKGKVVNSCFLKQKTIKEKQELDDRYIHIPSGLGNKLTEIKPDVVIAAEYNPAAIQALCWCRLHHVRFIHHTDGTLYSERNISKIQRLTRKIITSNADACIASSTKAKEKLLAWGVPKEKIAISLLTVDISGYRSCERFPVENRLLYVGSMIKRKGLDLLIHALQRVDEDFELHIVGNGTAEEIVNLKKLAVRCGIEDKIKWCGFKEGEDLRQEYAQAKVFVLPTREDCFGLVLLEAMCAGVPVVSSKYADGAYDIITEGVNGYLVDPYDEQSFAKTLEKALSNEQMQCAAEKTNCEKFSFEQVSKGFVDALEICKIK